MAKSDPLDLLLTHNQWANRQILDCCRELTDEQLRRSFDMGVGSLHATMTHVLGAMRGWGDMLAGREQRPRLEESGFTVDELVALNDELSDDLKATASAHPADEIVTATRGGKSYSFTRGGVFTHVTTHGMHHRAQCLNMLRHLGVNPLPPSAVVEWMLMVDPVQ